MSTYDSITNSTDLINYGTAPGYTNMYPDSNSVNIYGPIWLPRIYGKNLTAFEIASSGKIAITINDIHSLDVLNSTYSNLTGTSNGILTTFNTKSNYAMEMMTNNRDMKMLMDSYNNTMSLYAASNIDVTTSTRDIKVTAGSNLVERAARHVGVSADAGSLKLYANSSNMYISMSDTTSNISVSTTGSMDTTAARDISFTATASNFSVTAGTDIVQKAGKGVDVVAGAGSLRLYSAESNMHLTMDNATSNVDLYAAKSVSQVASGGSFSIYANASNMSLVMDSASSNLTMYSSSNMVVTAMKDMVVTASNNYALYSSSNIDMKAKNGSLKLEVNNSNMTFVMDSATNDTSLYTKNNLGVSVSNVFTMQAYSNVSLTALNGDFDISANNANMSLRFDKDTNNTSLYTAKSLDMTACNDTRLFTKSNMTIGAEVGSFNIVANNSNMYISMDKTTQDISVYAGRNIQTTASNQITMIASSNMFVDVKTGSYTLYANASNVRFVMDNSNDMSSYALHNIIATASNNYTVFAQSNIGISAENGSYTLFANKSNVTLKMNDATSSNLDAYASKDINLSASNSYSLNAHSNIIVNAKNGDYLMYSERNMFMTTHTSNTYIRMAMPEDTVTIYGLSNVSVTTSNAMILTSRTNMNLTSSNITAVAYSNVKVTACNNMTFFANDTISLEANAVNIATNSDISYTAQSNLNFYIKSSPVYPSFPVFTVAGNEVRVRGDLLITGSINTSNIITTDVQQNNLKVSDKTIILASQGSNDSADGLPADGFSTNDGAGIVVDGYPASVNSNEWEMYKKMFTWNLGVNGTLDIGTSNIESESYWDLQGGSFRMTRKKNLGTVQQPNIVELSFGFRINESDELELVKKFYNQTSSNYVFKRIAKFGRTL